MQTVSTLEHGSPKEKVWFSPKSCQARTTAFSKIYRSPRHCDEGSSSTFVTLWFPCTRDTLLVALLELQQGTKQSITGTEPYRAMTSSISP